MWICYIIRYLVSPLFQFFDRKDFHLISKEELPTFQTNSTNFLIKLLIKKFDLEIILAISFLHMTFAVIGNISGQM